MKKFKLNIENIAATVPVVYKKTYPFNGYINFSNSHAVRDEAELDKVYELYPNARPLRDLYSVYMHNTIEGICFNMIYQTRNRSSYGDQFMILGVIYVGSQKKVLLKIVFQNTFNAVIVPLQIFYTGQIYNPYHVRYFDCCSIGNVNILEHAEEFACWWELINRCFNPDHPMYDFYVRYWCLTTVYTCFEDLVKMNLDFQSKNDKYYQYPLITDPNDRLLYMKDGHINNMLYKHQYPIDNMKPIDPDTYRGAAIINRLNYTTTNNIANKLTLDKNYYIEKRIAELSSAKHAGGRPKKRKLMYKLI